MLELFIESLLPEITTLIYTNVMGIGQQTATWTFMMLTAIRKRFGLSRDGFIPIAEKYGLIGFLMDQYELLHYYDNDYIVDDVVRYIEEQGGSSRELLRTV